MEVITNQATGNNHRINGAVQATPTQASVDRTALLAELEATRAAVHALLNAISDERWKEKSPTTDWTVGELMVHVTWALEQLPDEIASARRGKGMFNLPLPKRMVDSASYWLGRWFARNETHASVGRRYDAAMDAVVRTLHEVSDADWSLGANFYGEGYYTITDLFHTAAEHFADHTAGM